MIRYSYYLSFIITFSSLLFPFIQSLTHEKFKPSRRDLPGKIEIRAIMVNCQPPGIFSKFSGASRKRSDDDDVVSSVQISEFRGFDSDEITMHSLVKDCKKKLVITMRLKNNEKTVTEEQFVVVDHVYDPVFKKRSRLLNPFVFKIKQNQVLQLYGLQFQNIVNGEVTEEVINKNLNNFTGCDSSSSHPTCGFSLSKDREIIPYSEGFCCSCDAFVNSQRQPHTGYASERSYHKVGPSPIHVKYHHFRRNRETHDYGDSDTNPESNKITNNDLPNGMETKGIQHEKNLPVTNGLSPITFQESENDQTGLEQRGNSQLQSDGDLSRSIGVITSNIGKKMHIETQNNYSHPLDENRMKSSIDSTSYNLYNDFEKSCNNSEKFKNSEHRAENTYDSCELTNGSRGQYKDQINLAPNPIENDRLSRIFRDENLNNGHKFLNLTFQNNQICDIDKQMNNGKFNRNLLTKNSQNSFTNEDIPLNIIKTTLVGFRSEENNDKRDKKSTKSAKNSTTQNSIFNAHDDLKPIFVPGSDEKISNYNSVRTTLLNNSNIIPILENPSVMEQAKGFKISDRMKSEHSPWDLHTTECPNNKYTSTQHDKFLHYLKFVGDSDNGDLGRMQPLKEVVQCTTEKLTAILSIDGSDMNKTTIQKRNLSRNIGAKLNKDNETVGEMQSRRKKIQVRRQASPNGNQIRGGQSCVDRSTPPGVDPIAYHESAHCLRFSELWYTVYRLKRPFVEHSLRLKLYEKFNYHDKSAHWDEITALSQTNLGTFNRIVKDEIPTFSFTYMPSSKQSVGPFQLDTEKSILLVPQPVDEKLEQKFPQTKGGPSEYLLLQSDQISYDGDECDKVGVGFSAFAKQPDRCGRVRGSCLRNQPLHLWQNDHEAMDVGKPGKYFLKNFACISSNPFIVNKSNSDEFLAIEYHNPYSATIEIEVKSDTNGIIRTGIGAQIPEVYIDATCDTNSKIVITVANMGLASSRFFSRLANCPGGLPEVWLTTRSPAILIAPQHQHRFHLSLFGTLPIGRFHCSIEVINDEHEIVATRRIRIQRYDRCFCLYHCLCACIASSKGLSCDQMSIEHYLAAGFLGSLPIETRVQRNVTVERDLNFWIYLLIALLLVPLLLGLIKAILGLCCCTSIGSAGMSMTKSGDKKGEEKQKKADKQVDEETGKPKDDTKEKPSRLTEFVSNIFIFFSLIFLLIGKLLKALCFILCCCGICPFWSGSGSGKGNNNQDDYSRRPSVRFSGVKDDDGGGGDDDGDDDEYEEDEDEDDDDDDDDDEDDEDEETNPVLKIIGGDDVDDDEEQESDTDLLEYFNRPDALEGNQVKKIMKKFKQYYKSNPPDQREISDDEVEGLTEYETKVAESFIDLLLESEEVYRHFNEPVGDIIMPDGFEYCIRGFLVKSDEGYFFIPPSPLLQYWTHDKQLMEPPQPLAFSDFEKAYDSAIDVLISYDLDLMPNGPAVNVYHL